MKRRKKNNGLKSMVERWRKDESKTQQKQYEGEPTLVYSEKL